MSDVISNSLQSTLLKGRRFSFSNDRLLLGARIDIFNLIPIKEEKQHLGYINGNHSDEYNLTIFCNSGIHMRDCEVDATICIEVGKEGDYFYSKHEYDAVFKDGHQDEVFNLINGKVYRDDNVMAGDFDNSVFDEDYQFHVTVTVHSVKGPRMLSPPTIDFRDPKYLHDIILRMDDGTKFYVQSQILSAHSAYFLRLFHSDFAESRQADIVISEVAAGEFGLMLSAIYPFPPAITRNYLYFLFILADRFDIPILTQKCIDFLSKEEKLVAECNVFDTMNWADKYNLLELQDFAYRVLEGTVSLHAHIKENEAEFNELPISVRERILYALYLRGENK